MTLDLSHGARADQPPYVVHRWSPDEFRTRLDELLRVYLAAMRYPDPSLDYRRPTWVEHSHRAGFSCFVALAESTATPERSGVGEPVDQVVGLCYGYTGGPQQWWNSEVRRGMTPSQASSWMRRYRELTELHVRPDRQGGGIGEVLLRAFLADAAEETVLLSTPEGENRAWRLYRRLGFRDVLRHYQFSGDPRPFAILGRSLPVS